MKPGAGCGAVPPYFSQFVEGRRGEVLDAALCVFAEKGYNGGTMRAIASRLGVTEPALYRHYAGKEALFADLVALAGDHVVRLSADGYSPAWRVVSTQDTSAAFTLEPASPELAATQWRNRTARGEPLDSEASVRLLSTSLRAPRLLVVSTDPAAPWTMRGALAVDGVLKARAEREGDAEGLIRDLLVRGQVVEEAPPLFKRWPFWVAVGAAAIAAGVTTAVVVGNKQTITRVELNP